MPLRALLLDFNSYFASVEQQLRPELRGKPVGIVPVLAETTCCIAASYEAKRRGVKTGTNVSEARQRCPGIVFVQARPRIYVEMHHRLMNVVDSVIAVSEVLSIDEVMCELTGSWRQKSVARELAREVKARIRNEVGECLTCSIGIGPNRFLAKTASNMQKPDGLTVLHESDLPDALFRLKLGDLNGIGRAMLARLERYGITSVEALCRASRDELRRVWGGVEGERMYDRLRGVDVPMRPTQRSSLGHSHVLPPHLRTDTGAFSVLSKLTQKAAARLRASNFHASRLGIQVDYRNRNPWQNEARFQPMQDTLPFLRVLAALWADRLQGKMGGRLEPIKVSVTLWDLHSEDQATLSLFPDGTRTPGLDDALDQLKARYGNDTIYFGGAFMATEEAPMRISFTHVPDIRLEADTKSAEMTLIGAE